MEIIWLKNNFWGRIWIGFKNDKALKNSELWINLNQRQENNFNYTAQFLETSFNDMHHHPFNSQWILSMMCAIQNTSNQGGQFLVRPFLIHPLVHYIWLANDFKLNFFNTGLQPFQIFQLFQFFCQLLWINFSLFFTFFVSGTIVKHNNCFVASCDQKYLEKTPSQSEMRILTV
jgi:hypothetical protein